MLKYNHVNSALCNFCLASSQGCPSDIHPWMFRSAFLLAQGAGESLIPSLMDRMFLLYSVSCHWIGRYGICFYWKGCWTVEQAHQSGVKAGDEEGEKRDTGNRGRHLPMSPFQGAWFIKPKGQYNSKNYTAFLVVLSCSGSTEVVSTRAAGAPRSTPGYHKRCLPHPGWDLGMQSWAGWIHGWWWFQCPQDGLTLKPFGGRPGLPTHLPKKCKTFVHWWVWFRNTSTCLESASAANGLLNAG